MSTVELAQKSDIDEEVVSTTSQPDDKQSTPATGKRKKSKKNKKAPTVIDKFISPQKRKAISDVVDGITTRIAAAGNTAGRWLWYGTTTTLVFVLPLALQIQREQALTYAAQAMRQ